MRRKPTTKTTDTKKPPSSRPSIFNYATIALIGGVFILGIGLGVGFSTTTTLSPKNVATSNFIDQSAPNPQICIQYGASAMVMDTRLFVTLNPFNVYIAQPSIRPGCVLRTNNWAILEQRKLVTSQQEQECKNRMNTFGFTGALESSPDISCIYQNDAAKNFFISQPGAVAPPEQTDKF